MPRKIGSVTRKTLVNAELPEATDTYTVISHNFVITNILKNLQENGFEVKEELYRCTKGAQVASGIYRINYDDDPDMGMIFAFGNSYDKSMRFKCAVGAYLYKNNASLISKMSDWNRKHTGTADEETQETILKQIENAMMYFNELKEHKEIMKTIELRPTQFHSFMGQLYFDKLITGEQMAVIRKEYEKPSYDYETPKNNLWTLYNHILTALKISHPRVWMEQQTMIHLKLATQFNLIEFDEEEVETTDEKQSDVSCTSQGNAGAFLPGYESKPIRAEVGEPSEEEKQMMMEAYQDDIEAGEYSEEEVSHMLYGVDNNPEVVISEPVDLDAEEEEDWDKLEKEGLIKEIDPRAEWAEQELAKEPEGEDVGPPEMYEDAEEKVLIDNTVEIEDEEEVPWIEDGEEPVELEEISEEEELEEVVDEEVSADLEMQEIKTEEIIEEKEAEDKPVESTGVLFDLEEGEEPGVKPVAGLDEPVQIMSPEESAEKSQLPAFSNAALGLGYDEDVITEWVVNGNYDGSLTESENMANFRSWASLIDSEEEINEEPAVDKSSPLYVAIQNELEELYGYKPEFTYTETNDQFNIVLESGESVVLSAAYINSLV